MGWQQTPEAIARRVEGIRRSKERRQYLPKEVDSPTVCTPEMMRRAAIAAQPEKRAIRADPLRLLGMRGAAGLQPARITRG